MTYDLEDHILDQTTVLLNIIDPFGRKRIEIGSHYPYHLRRVVNLGEDMFGRTVIRQDVPVPIAETYTF